MSSSIEASTNKRHEILLRRRSWDGIDSRHYEDIHHMGPDEARGLVRQINEAIVKAEEGKRADAKARIPEIKKEVKQLEDKIAALNRELALASESAE